MAISHIHRRFLKGIATNNRFVSWLWIRYSIGAGKSFHRWPGIKCCTKDMAVEAFSYQKCWSTAVMIFTTCTTVHTHRHTRWKKYWSNRRARRDVGSGFFFLVFNVGGEQDFRQCPKERRDGDGETRVDTWKVAQQGFILLTVVLPNLSSNSVVEISYKLTVNEFQREHRSELSSTVVSHETDASSSPTVEKRSYSLVPNDYHRNASLKQIMS